MVIYPQLDRRAGHDWGSPNFDSLGIFYICFTVVYTVIVAIGLVSLWKIRGEPAIRLRGFFLIISAVLALHLYGAFVIIVYPLNGAFKCGLEFWIMSTILPFGIALFQASNIRLLAYYQGQKSLTLVSLTKPYQRTLSFPYTIRRFKSVWSQLDFLEKTYVGIVVGLGLQLAVSLFLFFGSRKFHGSYGLFSENVGPGACRHGAEWLPSVFWQFIWSWIFGPYVLIKTRNISDAHYWARQTRFAIIAGLPGTPLWLVFLYSKGSAVKIINQWFVPAGWFLPGLFTMQAVSIIFPLLDARRAALLRECRSSFSGSTGTWTNISAATNERYSLASLEWQLERNIEPLLKWTAERDFTAENILFIKRVHDLKTKWGPRLEKENVAPEDIRGAFKESALIFFTLINPQTARFNINIDSKTYTQLANLFQQIEYVLPDDRSSSSSLSEIVAPWLEQTYHQAIIARPDLQDLENSPSRTSSGADNPAFPLRIPFEFDIPSKFSLNVFDKAYQIVKQDVFHNTWKRYEAIFGRPHSLNSFGKLHPRRSVSTIWRDQWASVKKVASQGFGALR